MPGWGNKTRGGEIVMSDSDLLAVYRLHAANCVEIAQRSSDQESKLALLAMAQAWLNLAEQATKISQTVFVYETPIRGR